RKGMDVTDVAKKARSSLVTIQHRSRGGALDGQGSGFLISKEGHVATNLHVIGEGRKMVVRLSDGEEHPVQSIHAWDRKLDLAILKVGLEGKEVDVLPLGDSADLPQGLPVAVMGNPQGLEFSVVGGVVSAMRDFENGPMIQLAIPIEPGNSGGPVLNAKGEVLGVVTMKSAVTRNLGFAMPVNALKKLRATPNSMPLERWLRMGQLDADQWVQVQEGAVWRRRGGTIQVRGQGAGFGGRALCLTKEPVPDEGDYEISVRVKLNDEAGAAGLAFASDGGDVHYGFYPSAGKLRLTRFEGPSVYDWTILVDQPSDAYRSGEWNRLRVRVSDTRIHGYVNDRLLVKVEESRLEGGQAGLCKFRNTEADFQGFQLRTGPFEDEEGEARKLARLKRKIQRYSFKPGDESAFRATIAKTPELSRQLLDEQAKVLRDRIEALEGLRDSVHQERILGQVREMMETEESEWDLVRAALLIPGLSEPGLEVGAYEKAVQRLAAEALNSLPDGEALTDREKLVKLSHFLFQEGGFHGSRVEYYNRSNSFLNAVIDDREGIPITLSVLYLELAKRIGISELHGIPLPGHFVVQHRPEGEAHQLIDVFHDGRFLSLEEAEELAGRPLE
ncbi:MAG: transglutaminase family protein, partial [Verrucomicrobiota bacterium]